MTETERQAPPQPTEPTTPPARKRDDSGVSTMAIGLILVLIGAALFGGQLLNIGIDDIGWPFFLRRW